MAIKLVLSAEQIGNKIFKGVPRGYDPYEVDKFLDQIIMDYERVESNYLASSTEIEETYYHFGKRKSRYGNRTWQI